MIHLHVDRGRSRVRQWDAWMLLRLLAREHAGGAVEHQWWAGEGARRDRDTENRKGDDNARVEGVDNRG